MIRYDTTPFIRESIHEVFKTLLDAVILVALVVLVFLQNWRSAIIPLIAVPVGIIGTFAVMLVMGFTLNNLTLFGLVLAIGIVVDDAIVVVEAVEHHIEHGLKPRDATIKAMSEVSAPVIAVGLVLSRGVHPLRVHHGNHRAVLPAVRADDRLVDGDLDVQLADAEPGPGGDAVASRGARGVYDTLPWPAFLILGAWAGLQVPGPYWPRSTVEVERRSPPAARRWRPCVDLARSIGHRARDGRALAGRRCWGRSACLVASASRSNWVCGVGFRAVQSRLPGHRRRLRGLSAGMLRVFVLVLLVYGGVLGLTYWGFMHTPARLHPVAGHGLPAGQHPASRLGVARADPGGDRPDRTRSPTRSRASTPRWASPASRCS